MFDAVCPPSGIAPEKASEILASDSSTTWSDVLESVTRCAIVAVPLFVLVLGLIRLQRGWDDAAITASFARTYAETGRFALTPSSVEVEGFSSISWALLLSIPRYFSNNPDAILVWMKFLASLSFGLSLLVFHRMALRLLQGRVQASLATLTMAFMVPPMREAMNGMEMNLYMLLLLYLVDILTREKPTVQTWISSWLLAPALILTRFEAPYLIALLAVGVILARLRKALFHLTVPAAVSFALLEAWRHSRFGVWMPNTAYAKLQFPYSTPMLWSVFFHSLGYPSQMWFLLSKGGLLNSRLQGTLEILHVFRGPLLLVVLVGTIGYANKRVRLFWFALNSRTLAVLLGALLLLNLTLWLAAINLADRCYISVFEAAIFVVVPLLRVGLRDLSALKRSVFTISIGGLMFGIIFGKNLGYDGRMTLACIPFLVLLTFFFLERSMPPQRWKPALFGACLLVQLPVWTMGAWASWQNAGLPAISGAENRGRNIDLVRRILHRDSLYVMLPDVGGSTLCCEKLTIYDSALLANPLLARRGYSAFEEYLRETRPDVIESHDPWSSYSRLYQSELMKDYSVVILNGQRLLLRNPISDEFKMRTGAPEIAGKPCLEGTEALSLDEAFAKSRKSCLYVYAEDGAQAEKKSTAIAAPASP